MRKPYTVSPALLGLFQFLLCLSSLFLCLFAALGLTLWRTGYLVGCMDRANYPTTITQALIQSCKAYAQAYSLEEGSVLDGWDEALVRQELIRSVDETYHEVQRGRSTPFDTPDAALARCSDPQEQPLSQTLASLWNQAVQAPFGNLLNILLQYSRTSSGPISLFLAVCLGSLLCLFFLAGSFRELAAFLRPVGQCTLLCTLVFPAGFALVCSRFSWLDAQSLALGVFHRWAAGFFFCLAFILALAGLGWLVFCHRLDRIRSITTPSPQPRQGKIKRRAPASAHPLGHSFYALFSPSKKKPPAFVCEQVQ